MNPDTLELDHILDAQAVEAYFHPIVSVRRGRVMAMEALARGRLPGSGIRISPQAMFAMAKTPAHRLALDRLCRKKALEAFAAHHPGTPDMALSLNIDASILDEVAGSGHFEQAVRQAGLPPKNVIIEIIESRVADPGALLDFTTHYRGKGFLIALDDVGSGHSNLDRLSQIKPDILKLDRHLVASLDSEYHRRAIVASLVHLAGRIGALPVAEGVETEAEINTCLALDIDLFQGFYFARPAPPGDCRLPALRRKVARVAEGFRRHSLERVARDRAQEQELGDVAELVLDDLARAGPADYDTVLMRALEYHQGLECLFILDDAGIQVSSTVCRTEAMSGSRSLLYTPARPGTDHSLKEYFIPVIAGMNRHVTGPYISLASGNVCRTLTVTFTDGRANTRCLCLDLCLECLANAPAN
jgi:EAL domain-containing protein (putative c-di-GMP-specific phosphodiesterase class I)